MDRLGTKSNQACDHITLVPLGLISHLSSDCAAPASRPATSWQMPSTPTSVQQTYSADMPSVYSSVRILMWSACTDYAVGWQGGAVHTMQTPSTATCQPLPGCGRPQSTAAATHLTHSIPHHAHSECQTTKQVPVLFSVKSIKRLGN